jgi:hypothetical protein
MRATTFRRAVFLGAMYLGATGMALLSPLAGANAQVWHGNDTGGIIPWSCENEAVAPQAAAGYCAQYSKYARITGVNRRYGDYISFNCLWNPNVARYALPAVATRAACIGEPGRFLTK